MSSRAEPALQPCTQWYFVYVGLRHKHLEIEQGKLDRAERLLRVTTEQETLDRALDAILAEAELVRAHRKVRGVGGFVDVFGRAE